MEEENKSTITYDENWQSVAETEYPEVASVNKTEEKKDTVAAKKVKKGSKQLVVTIQLILFAVLAVSAFVLKNIGGDIYNNVREWYYGKLNASVIFDGKNSFNIEDLFPKATSDEA